MGAKIKNQNYNDQVNQEGKNKKKAPEPYSTLQIYRTTQLKNFKTFWLGNIHVLAEGKKNLYTSNAINNKGQNNSSPTWRYDKRDVYSISTLKNFPNG